MRLVRQKFEDSGEEFNVQRIFKRGYKIYNKWEDDLLPLTIIKPDFRKVMRTLTKFFKYREYKKKNAN